MNGTETADGARKSSAFDTTRWTVVLQAAHEDAVGREALADLCRAYWLPLFVYVRRRGYSAPDAEDLTQGFFAELLRRGAVRRADQTRGRFRAFLLTALQNYLHNAHDHARAARRGGTHEIISISAHEASDALEQLKDSTLSPDEAFDRSWTLALLDRAMKRLAAEQAKVGKSRWFERVRPCLQARADPGLQDVIAVEFNLSRNAVAVAIHRLSSRYRELVRAEIAETVTSEEELAQEQRDLLRSVQS